jgi:hypothetical protein
MVAINYYAELAVASIRIILIVFAIMISINLMIKTQGKFKTAIILLMVSFIPSILYTIGRILNIEAEFASGKFLSLTLNTTTTIFTLIALVMFSRLVGGMGGNRKKKNSKNNKKQRVKGLEKFKEYKERMRAKIRKE